MREPAVYILASKPHGTLYVGMTSDLVKRVWEHRKNVVEGFTSRYGVHRRSTSNNFGRWPKRSSARRN